jgi:hypothetical protein
MGEQVNPSAGLMASATAFDETSVSSHNVSPSVARGAEWAIGPHVAERAERRERTRQVHSARGGVGVGPHVAKRAERGEGPPRLKNGAGNGIRTRDFDLGKVALYH